MVKVLYNTQDSLLYSGYWCGYRDNGTPTPLNQIPPYVQVAILAFAGLNPNSTMTTSYLCEDFTAKQIQTWAQEIRARGQKVTMSVIDSEKVHWNQIDLEKYVQSAKQTVMDEWGLDGFDIDTETPVMDELKKFIPMLRKAIGKDAIISFTCYTGLPDELSLLKAVKDEIDWVQTMCYGYPFESMIQRAEDYAQIVGKERVAIGVKVTETPLEECTKLAHWVRANGYKGMMLWSTDMDNPTFTHQKEWTWAETVEKGLIEPMSQTEGVVAHMSRGIEWMKSLPMRVHQSTLRLLKRAPQ